MLRLVTVFVLSLSLSLIACTKDGSKPTSEGGAASKTSAATDDEPAPKALEAPKGAKIGFKDLKDGATVKSPLTVCMTAEGLVVEPSGPVSAGKGHHHILVDIPLPTDLNQDIPKDAQHIHLGDGSTCKDVTLTPGKHTLRLLFADGSHRPYAPALTAQISVTVAE